AFLRRLMLDTAFAQGDLDTGLIERQHASLFPPVLPANTSTLALAIATLLASRGLSHSTPKLNKPHTDPWARTDGWRMAGAWEQSFSFLDNGELRELLITRDGSRWACVHDGVSTPFEWDARSATPGQYRVRIHLNGHDASATVILRNED